MSSSFRRGTVRRNHNPKSLPSESFPGSSPASRPSRPTRTHAVFERVGTKPWTGGLTLTSSGLREWDAILGGGQPLGTAILMEEDRWTQDLALALVRYWSAEAVAQGQTLALVSTIPNVDPMDIDTLSDSLDPIECQQGTSPIALQGFLRMLPRNQHLDKSKAKSDAMIKRIESAAANKLTVSSLQGFEAIAEDDTDADNDDFEEEETDLSKGAEEGLTNAWQYKVSVQQERFGKPISSKTPSTSNTAGKGSNVFCHSYDLSGKMEDQQDSHRLHDSELIDIVHCAQSRSSAISFFRTCIKYIQEKLQAYPNTVVRMVFLNVPVKTMSAALPLLLSHIREQSLPVVVLMTVRPWLRPITRSTSFAPPSSRSSRSYSPALIALKRTCDAVFTCEGFSAMVTPPPSEFSDLAGILSIQKIALQSLSHFSDTTTNRRPPANRYGMKRDRRKMHIRMLHLPPEDYSEGGSSVGGGARSGAGKQEGKDVNGPTSKTALQPGMGCSTNKRSSTSSLDF